jgi:hypothetical protein
MSTAVNFILFILSFYITLISTGVLGQDPVNIGILRGGIRDSDL